MNGAATVSSSRSREEIGYLSAEEKKVENACTKMNTFQAPTHTHSHDLVDIIENGGSWWRWALVQRGDLVKVSTFVDCHGEVIHQGSITRCRGKARIKCCLFQVGHQDNCIFWKTRELGDCL